MIHQLAQLKLPGGSSVAYPQGFTFKGNGGIGSIISTALPLIIGLAGLALLLMFVSAGFSFMTSAGDAKKMEKAKGQLTNAVLGFVIVFGAYWLVQIVGIMFGADLTAGFK